MAVTFNDLPPVALLSLSYIYIYRVWIGSLQAACIWMKVLRHAALSVMWSYCVVTVSCQMIGWEMMTSAHIDIYRSENYIYRWIMKCCKMLVLSGLFSGGNIISLLLRELLCDYNFNIFGCLINILGQHVGLFNLQETNQKLSVTSLFFVCVKLSTTDWMCSFWYDIINYFLCPFWLSVCVTFIRMRNASSI